MKKNIIKGYFILIYSLTLLFVLINNFAKRTEDHWRFFYNFTQQSNILALIWFVLLAIHLISNQTKLKFVRNKIVMVGIAVYVSITYFIVALVLDPIYLGMFNPVSGASELWLHHLTPIAVWILFAVIPGEGELTIVNSLLTLIYPLVYLILNLIVGSTVKFANGDPAYAYGFVNPNIYSNVAIFIVVIVGLLLVFSAFTIGLTKFKLYIDKERS